jgi:hypothetical protein
LYLGKCSLKDGLDTVHEQRIGTDLFGRPNDYDTGDDNIVRTNVSELRKRVEAYFEGEGADESIIVQIPRGSYIPVFRYRPVKPRVESEASTAIAPAPAPDNAVPGFNPPTAALSMPAANHPNRVASILNRLLIAGLVICCIVFRYQYNSLYRSMYPWQYQPAVAALWTNILNARPNTDIVLADASFGLLQKITTKFFPLDAYLDRSYISQLQTENASPDLRPALSRITTWNLGDQNDFMLARRILALDPLGTKIHLYNARSYRPDLISDDNVILIGGRLSNPWDELFEGNMNFVANFSADGPPTVVNRAPLKGEQTVFVQTDSTQYCVVSYRPNPHHNGIALLIEGTGAEATEAAGQFLFSGDQLSAFTELTHSDRFPYFDVLLKVSSVPGTPLTASIAAYRVYPNLH